MKEFDDVLKILLGFFLGLASTAYGIRLKDIIDAKKNQVRWVAPDKLRVEYKALKPIDKEKGHFYIPGEGRLELIAEQIEAVERCKGEVAFICTRIGQLGSVDFFYRAGMPIPLSWQWAAEPDKK